MLYKDDVLLQVNVFVYNVVQVRCLATGKCACVVYNIVQLKKKHQQKTKTRQKTTTTKMYKYDVLLQVNVFVYNIVQVWCLVSDKCVCM